WFLLAFMCSHSRLTQQRQKYGKEIAEAGFRLFWNNINQQMMDYQGIYFGIKAPGLNSRRFKRI
ncbi:MAG: hypothetical protein WCB90_07825, partial [Methanosarcina sp.]